MISVDMRAVGFVDSFRSCGAIQGGFMLLVMLVACLFALLAMHGHCLIFPDQQVWDRSHAPCGGVLQQQNVTSRSMLEM